MDEDLKSRIKTRKLAYGVYEATPALAEVLQHSCVCYADDKGLVAVTGPAGDEEGEKYAELFAAAPEMLEALETMNRFWTDPDFDDISVCIAKVRVAIFKAGGNENLEEKESSGS